MDLCQECTCKATVETIWGDDFCEYHYEHGPTNLPCPQCSQDATPAGLPVAADDDRPDDAPSASPSALGATISPVVETVPPSHLLPPESTTGGTLDGMLQALTWCVTRAYDDDAPRGVIDAAERGLTVFANIIRAVTP